MQYHLPKVLIQFNKLFNDPDYDLWSTQKPLLPQEAAKVKSAYSVLRGEWILFPRESSFQGKQPQEALPLSFNQVQNTGQRLKDGRDTLGLPLPKVYPLGKC